ncbi:EamA family transporter RarD [Xanthomonas sp. WHRI 1810A]|uniref:EamA family transporter RarD n=1 Tax=Xanthomonas sp. WHRI 1810A TaxID=3161565 RepID=UPI0032E86B9B
MYKGVALSVMASCLFAVMYFYTSLLTPLTGEEIFGWRMLLTLPCATLFLLYSGDWTLVRTLTARVRQNPAMLGAMALSAALVSVQLWLFMWAPLHGRSLEVALGYFLLPLSMILTGRVVFGEHLSRLQKIAAGCALIGVGNELLRLGGISWETLVVALGYPLYFVLRRKLKTDNLGGLWWDMLLVWPVALLIVWNGNTAALDTFPRLYALIPILGAISASALVSYILASRLLPFSVFGLLSYVEPVLLIGVALLLGESIQRDEWMTYLPIWAAVMVLMVEGAKHVLAQRRRNSA